MPRPKTFVRPQPAVGASGVALAAGPLESALEALMGELEIPGDFSPQVLADAEASAKDPDLPSVDWTEIPFVTIDPPSAMDLDQAVHLERRASGYRVRYAIADVPAFVRPGSPMDQEARRRGQTLYAPHRRVPLHPAVVSESAASLLPLQVRPAFVWVIDLDADGEPVEVDVVRAMVRSTARHDYEAVQDAHTAGRIPEPFTLLPVIGRQLIAQERARGGASLGIPDQEIDEVEGGYVLRYRPKSEVEDWNAQISLLTGMVAADLMLAAGVGLLRTMPAPDDRTVSRFRRQAKALGANWPAEQEAGEFLRSLDPRDPSQLALLHESAVLFRGAGYTPFDGAAPERVEQAAVAAEYAHVTAPLRRLVDRFTLVACESICRDTPVPDWVRQALPALPEAMMASDRLSGTLERASIELAEAATLAHRVGEVFDAVVVDDGGGRQPREDGTERPHLVQLLDPAVLAGCSGAPALGTAVKVRLDEADVQRRVVRFSAVSPVDGP